MKWKITIQFMLAVLAVSIVSNLINVIMSMYFSYEEYSNTQIISGLFSAVIMESEQFSPDDQTCITFITDMINEEINPIVSTDSVKDSSETGISGINIYKKIILSQTFIKTLTSKEGWVQVIDSQGKEVESINKPETIKTYYTRGELEKAAAIPMRVQEYVITVAAYGSEEFNDMSIVVGVPKPDFNIKIMSDNLNYLRYKDMKQIITSGITLFIALVLGYLFAVRINRPVVRMTDGITAMSRGDYDVVFPRDSFYKKVYESLDHMASALKSGEAEREKVEKMREEWITNISHDLRTPLSSIKGYSELLYEAGDEMSLEDLQKYIGILLEKSAYMGALIDDLKLTQKLKNDLIPLKKEKANLVDIFRDIVIGILNDPKYENRKIYFEPDGEEVMMEFDQLLFKRALTNILINALVHNPEETEIRVCIHMSDRVTVEIEDNGKGISEENRERLFERYYRGTSTNESYAGSGLGLAIAREIITVHGGKIGLESKTGEGTIVRIFL